jgi:hypothetical protein
VLDATVALLEDSPMVADAAITERTGFDPADVRRALEALDGTYVHLGRDMSGFFVDAVTAGARRAVGQWPTGESLVSQLAEGLAAAAEKEADPERKTRLRQATGLLGGAVRDIAVEIAERFAERAAGLG